MNVHGIQVLQQLLKQCYGPYMTSFATTGSTITIKQRVPAADDGPAPYVTCVHFRRECVLLGRVLYTPQR